MVIVTTPQLKPKLAGVLARACERLGAINKSQAAKFPYLVDVVAVGVLGRRITEGTHQAWQMGVVTKEAYQAVEHGWLPESFVCRSHPDMAGGVIVSLNPARSAPDELSAEEQLIVDFVADQYGKLKVTKLGELTKRLNPEISRSDWMSTQRNPPAKVDKDAYARLGDDYQHYTRRLAGMDIGDTSQWGSPIEANPREYLRRILGR